MKFESRQALSLNQVPMNRADNIQHDKVALCCAVQARCHQMRLAASVVDLSSR